MKRISALTVILVCVIWQSTQWSTGSRTLAQQQTSAANSENPELTERQRQRMLNSFQPAREMLLRKGVPFNPDLLLEPDWKSRLESTFAQMSELQDVRRVSNRLEGVEMADTLYLPEKVEITGDIVIIARRLIFEGTYATLKGPHNIYVFPTEAIGSLGMSLETAMQEQGIQISQAGIQLNDLKSYVPNIRRYGIKIDASGRGYKEWLEEQKQKRPSRRALNGVINKDGSPGAEGAPGEIGTTGSSGSPDPAKSGENGTCNSLYPDPDGKPGTTGNGGGDGVIGFIGGRGDDGGDGGEIVFTIPTSTGSFEFYSNGGQGGKGGRGGQGGTGGKGADGGRGGDGKDCSCEQGGAGNGGDGGDGGPGGKGGTGGTGGRGGTGGAGGTIRYTKPSNFQGLIVYRNSGGHAGHPGDQGPGGYPGNSGSGGAAGRKGSNFNCTITEGRDGRPGGPLTSRGFGEPGQPGQLGERGEGGPPPGVTEGPCAPPEGGCSGGKGYWSQAQCTCIYSEERPSPSEKKPFIGQQPVVDQWYRDIITLLIQGLDEAEMTGYILL